MMSPKPAKKTVSQLPEKTVLDEVKDFLSDYSIKRVKKGISQKQLPFGLTDLDIESDFRKSLDP